MTDTIADTADSVNVSYDTQIPNNVGLSGDKRVLKALEAGVVASVAACVGDAAVMTAINSSSVANNFFLILCPPNFYTNVKKFQCHSTNVSITIKKILAT